MARVLVRQERLALVTLALLVVAFVGALGWALTIWLVRLVGRWLYGDA